MRLIKCLAGLLLAPACVLLALVFADLVVAVIRHAAQEGWPRGMAGLAWGLFAGGLGFGVLPRPVWAYVLGHELTHAAAALLRGGRVSRLRVRRSGGSVAVSRAGVWVSLSPYVVPPATLLVLLAWGLFRIFSPETVGQAAWFFAVGLSWGFHVGFTAQALTRPQPDIRAHGWIFSLVVIFGLNLAAATGLVYAAAPQVRSALPRAAEARVHAVVRILARARDRRT